MEQLEGLIMEELYVNINELVQDLLIPARVEKNKWLCHNKWLIFDEK